MPCDFQSKRATFRALHKEGCFILPSPSDIGRISAPRETWVQGTRFNERRGRLGGRTPRRELSRDDVLEHLRLLCRTTDLPVNGDFESGFADEPVSVAANVALALETGVVGLWVEDRTGRVLYEQPLAVDRIKAAHEAVARSGQEVVLIGRSEGFLGGLAELSETIDRLVAYADAGADCLYALGMTDLSAIRTLVSAVAPKPVNVLLIGPNMRVADLAAAGVRRVSVGGALAAAAWSGFDQAVQLLAEVGMLPKRP